MKKGYVALGLATAMSISMTTAAQADHVAKDAYHDEVKIAVCLYSDADNTAAEFHLGFDSVFDNYDNVTYQVFDANGSADTQVAQLEDTVIQGFDAVMVQATDEQGIVMACQEVMDAGIPLISLNLAPDCGHAVCVSVNGQASGRLQAEKAIEDTVKDSGKWVFIAPPEGALGMVDMPFYGFKQYMETVTDNWELLEMQCGDYSTEMGQQIMADLLTKYPEIDFVYATSDEMAEGAAMACEAAGRTEVNVYGAGGSEKMFEYIDKGLCTGTVFNDNVSTGELAAKFAMYAITSDVDLNQQAGKRTIYSNFYLVDKDNTDEARADLKAWGVME